MKTGSLFSGYEGLTMAVERVTGARTAWCSDIDPGAKRLLQHRWPDVPNLGDITAIDWLKVEPVDILTGGFPCQDLSAAGKRAGMGSGTRSGLWTHMATAVMYLRPKLVVIENVRGLLSGCAESTLEPCPGCVGVSKRHRPVLRGAGRVVGDLSGLGYDTRWVGLRAADIGAPHGRYRVFVVAYPNRAARRWDEQGCVAPGSQKGTVQQARWGAGRDCDPCTSAHPHCDALRQQSIAEPRRGSEAIAGRTGEAAPDSEGDGWARLDDGASREAARGGRQRVAGGSPRLAPPAHADDATGNGQWAREEPRQGTPTAADAERGGRPGRSPEPRRQQGGRTAAARHSEIAWGAYEPAIRRWESLTRVAPAPTETGPKGGQRLAPRFVEWLMGLPEGHVTDVPDLSRNDQLKLLGNGVVPQQAEAAIRHLLSDKAVAA